MKNGVPKLYVAGEFHFERYPRERWEEEILKMKAGGVDVISAYIVWIFHEEKRGQFNFSGNYDDAYFLSLCKKHNMGVIMRIGPYVHGELRHGGLPDFIFNRVYNRSNHPEYLALAKRYWERLYESTKEYYDGKTVVAIQLENEYVRGFGHLLRLRQIAEEIGFKVPIFTVTGWGFTFDKNDLQGTYGGYPARPWAQHKKQMPVQGNFTIREAFHDWGIGDDVIKYKSDNKPQRAVAQPNFTCECGCGNQVTEHRREIISTNDAFGVPFATVANGCNWLGYYMFHGSNNPRGGLYQESRISFSPNNCPIIDYDFQAPLGRFGVPKQSYKRLKSLNYCMQYFGDRLAPMWKHYDPNFEITSDEDAITPRICVRVDKNSSGFLFVSTYEREQKMLGLQNVKITVDTPDGTLSLPKLNVSSDKFVMYPFNIEFSYVKYDYITASPVAHLTKDGVTTYYFKTTGDLKPTYSIDGKEKELKVSDSYNLVYNKINKDSRIVVMTEELSDDFYIISGRVIFSNAIVYGENSLIIEYKDGDYCVIDGKKLSLGTHKVNARIGLRKKNKFKARYKRYLFSKGEKKYYEMRAENVVFNNNIADYILDMDFKGSTLQMYCQGELIDDFYNIEGNYSISLSYFKNEVTGNRAIDIITAPFTQRREIYTEKEFDFDNAELSLKRITPIFRKTVKFNSAE